MLKRTQSEEQTEGRVISTQNWNDIATAGLYVHTEYPLFFRVTEQSLIPGGSPSIHSSDFTVAKLSDDPMLAKSRIQYLCANNNLPVPP